MLSAPAVQHCRFCGRFTVGARLVRPRNVVSAAQRRHCTSITTRTRTFVDHADPQVQPSELHADSSTTPIDNVALTEQHSKGGKLDDSLPYVAVLKASKQHKHPVQEKQRALAEYMQLPASQYSVLDAKKIERLDDDTFVCYVGGLNFLGFVVEPVLKVSVIVQERGPVVRLLDTKLQGSKAIVAANNRFDAIMTNVVTWEGDESQEVNYLCSSTSIQVALEIPRWARMMPTSAVESAGSRVMQTVLNSTVPKFLKQLQKDYELWAAGDESRKPVGTGQL